MVAVPRLREMKYAETPQSAKIIEPMKHWKTDADVNFQLIIDKLEIWGKAQRESARRPKSDWGKLGGG